jgi:hypothetical protein
VASGDIDPLATDKHRGCLDNNGRIDPMLSAALDFISLCNDVEWKLAWEYLDTTSEESALGKDYSPEYLRNTYAGPTRCKGLCGWMSEEDSSVEMTYYFHCQSMKSNALKVYLLYIILAVMYMLQHLQVSASSFLSLTAAWLAAKLPQDRT